MSKLLHALGLLLLLSLCSKHSAYSQGYNFNLVLDSGNPRGLNTETDSSTLAWTPITSGGESVNSWSTNQSLPFTFNFYGSPVTAFKVSKNGLLTFSTSASALPSANQNLPTNSLPDKTIACFWDEFTASPPLPAQSRVYTKVFGTAPNRQLWIKWNKFEIGNPTVASAHFSCVLEEGTNKVYLVDMNYATSNVTATIGLQATNTNAFQFGSNNFGFFNTTSGTSPSNNDYYEFTPQVTVDAGIVTIDSPTVPFASGNSNVQVTLRNYSQVTLNTVTIKWSINNVPQPDYIWSGSLAPNTSVSGVNIGSFNFEDGSNYNIQVSTSDPNGTNDIDPLNDAASKSVCPMLLGNYIIGGANADFPTLTAAVNALHCAGIESSVRFVLAPGAGPFNESVTINQVPGVSATKTITIDGGLTKEKITSTGFATIRLNGADRVILENLTIDNLAATAGNCILLVNQADNNIIRNCVINAKPGAGFNSDFYGILIGTSDFTGLPNNGSFNLIENNEINDGRGGIYMRNSGNATADQQNRIINNRIIASSSYGVYSRYQKQVYIQNNLIDMDGTSTGSYAIQSEYDDYFEITGNKLLNFANYGIYINYGNSFTGSNSNRAKIINNMIISSVSSTSYGIRMGTNSNFINVYHNSVSITNGGGYGFYAFGSSNLNIRNNSFSVTNTTSTFNRLVYLQNGTNVNSLDYNNYYITGASTTVIYINNTDYTSANFIGAAGFNQNSFYGDPGYLDPNKDLHAITAQLNDKGDNTVGVTVDIDGNSRPAVSGGQVDIGVDEFTVFPQDISIAAITAPAINGRVSTSKALKSNETISVRLVNTGGQILTNIPVYYSINGVTSAQETVAGPISPGQSLVYSFTAKADLSSVGSYQLKAYTAFSTDNDRNNDTLSNVLIRQLPNAPIVFPYLETFESMASETYNSEVVGLPGAEKFDFNTSAPEGRLRSFAGTGFAYNSNKAITLDKNIGTFSIKPVNELTLTANLSAYTTSDIILLDFAYIAHFTSMTTNDPGNRVWIRGSDTSPWIQIYDLVSNRSGSGVYKQVQNINLSTVLAANSQSYTSSFQIKFGQEGTGRASSNTCCGGFSFDNIGLRRLLQRDLTATAIVAPAANTCGDSNQTVSVRVQNLGVNAQSNIPVTVKITGPNVNTTLSGTIAGPLANGQTAVVNLGTINTYAGGMFDFTAYTNFATDEDRTNDTLRSNVFINTIPPVPAAVNNAGCEGDPITLSVNGVADGYNWYASTSSNTVLASSATYQTPPLSTTTTFYASAINFTQTAIGPADNQIGSGGNINLFNAGLQFDVFRELIIDTLFIYPASTGNVSINLINAAGTVIATKTMAVTAPNVKTPVAVNFRVQPGSAYRLDAQGSTISALYRNGAGSSFPYTIPNTLSITQGTFGNDIYYFFYDWKVTIIECESNRIPVVATVNPKPIVDLGNDTINCGGGSVFLDAGNSGNGFTYLWSNGATTQTMMASTTGLYSVTVTNPITGCAGTDQIQVTIGTPPTVNLGTDISQCGGSVVLDAGNPGFDYLWSMNNQAIRTLTVTQSGTYSVIVTDPATGCSGFDTIQVSINSSPVVNLGADVTQCGGSVTLNAGNAGMTYLWNTGATTQTISASTSGIYFVDVTNATNCTTRDSVVITINPVATVNLGADVTQCGGTVMLDAGNAGMTFLWNTGATTQTITASTSGIYFVDVTNANNCTTRDSVVVTINANPTVNLGADVTQCGGTVNLNAGNAGMNYLWSNGATTQSITVSASGTYSVTVTNPATGCTGTDQAQVTINSAPVVNLGADVTQCGGTVALDAGNAGMTYLWNTGATTQTITASTSGIYFVDVTNANNCTTRDTVVVTINANPTVNLGADVTQCGGTVTLNAGNAGMNYLWSNGATTQSITVSASGTYSVTVTNPATGCTGTDQIAITINPKPSATITASGPLSFCQGGTVSLSAPAGLTYLWSNGSTAQNIVASTSGKYKVIVTGTNGCTSADSVNVIVNSLPVVNLGADVTQCGGSVTLNAGNAGMTYLWNTGATTQTISASTSGIYYVDVTNANNCTTRDSVVITINPVATVNLGADVTQCGGTVMLDAGNAGMTFLWNTGATTQTITASTSGIYFVDVTNANNCTTRDTVVVTINANPTVNLGADVTQCGGTVTLNAGNAGMNYLWSNGATTQNITVSASGTYSVTVTNPATGCTGTDQAQVTINSAPVVNLGADVTQCGGTVALDAGNAGMTYLWNTGATTQTITASTSGIYFVDVTNANNCTTRDSVVVTINANPTVNLGADITQCGGTVTLDAGTSGSLYLWNNGATTRTIQVSASGVYFVGVANPTGCFSTDTIVVTITTPPTVLLGNDTTICSGATLLLDAGNAGASYTWSDNSTAQTLSVNAAGIYWVDVLSSNGCTTRDSLVVSIAASTINSGYTYLSSGANTTFTNTSTGATTYKWDFGDGNASNQQNPVHTYSASGTYTVQLIASNGCTSDTTTSVINVVIGLAADFDHVIEIYPNPNKGQFVVKVEGYTSDVNMTLLNATGQVVHRNKIKPDGNGIITQPVDLTNLATGIYLLRLETKDGIQTRKVVIQN